MKAVMPRKELLHDMGGNNNTQPCISQMLVQLNSYKILLANQDDSLGILASGLAERVKMTGNFPPFETGFGTNDMWQTNMHCFRDEMLKNIM